MKSLASRRPSLMATTSTTRAPPPPVKAEHDSTPITPPPPQQLKTTAPVRQEPQELPHPPTNNPATETSENYQFQLQPPQFSSTVTELRNLSASLSVFLRRYDELHMHLDFIRSATDAQLPQHFNPHPSPPQPSPIVPLTKTPASAPQFPQRLNTHPFPPQPSPIVPLTKTLASATADTTTESPQTSEHHTQSRLSEIESLCKSMSSRGLRDYIVSHLSEAEKLREEATAALKLAPIPAKLVLECSAFPGRQASVLILESFLMMGGCNDGEIEASVKEKAELAAVKWRNRLANEGGMTQAGEIDARGLLLFISCFGVPNVFKNEDVRDLIQASNAKEISDCLRKSHVLLARISEVIEEMMKNKLVVKAVDIAYTFGLEGRFPPRICLQNFLQESRETWKIERKVARTDESVNEASKKHLADLKSALKCLQDHKIDPFIVGWNIHSQISSLEKDIAHLDKKIEEKVTRKREADKPESSKHLTSQEVKRTRLVSHHGHHQQQKVTAYAEGKSSSDGLIPTNLPNGGIPGHISSFSASPSELCVLPTGSELRVLPTGSELHVLPTGSYAGVHGGMLVDSVGQVKNNGQPYGWHGDAPFRERLIGHSYAEHASLGVNGLFRPPPPVVGHMGGMQFDSLGQVMSNNGQPYGWHGDAPSRERLIGHSLFRPPPSMEGFAGLPNPSSTGVPNRSSASDLYGFADTVL